MGSFKLDKNAFAMQKLADEEKQKVYKHLTPQQRLEIAYYLNCVAYNFTKPPKMDKTAFSCSKR